MIVFWFVGVTYGHGWLLVYERQRGEWAILCDAKHGCEYATSVPRREPR